MVGGRGARAFLGAIAVAAGEDSFEARKKDQANEKD